jgi:DNA-binding NarL/FixJ family response regulator
MQVVPVPESDDDSAIFSLLDDIASARDRLKCAIDDAKDERARFLVSRRCLQETQWRLRDTWSRFLQPVPSLNKLPNPRKLPGAVSLDKLTAREVQVLRLIAEGLSTKEIAAQLTISFKTAVTHRTHILAKLNCHESASLVRAAFRAGLVA